MTTPLPSDLRGDIGTGLRMRDRGRFSGAATAFGRTAAAIGRAPGRFAAGASEARAFAAVKASTTTLMSLPIAAAEGYLRSSTGFVARFTIASKRVSDPEITDGGRGSFAGSLVVSNS